jgi:hypothetical protein
MKRYFIYILLLSLGCSRDYVVPNHFPGVVKVFDNRIFVAYGEGGLIVKDIITNQVIAHVFPPRDMRSIDDFDVDGDLLFIIDARNRNSLAVYSIADINNPELVDAPIEVHGGPFNGISAKSGNVVVAGGTGFLEFFQYSNSGELSGPVTFGRDRGHPDVLLSEDGLSAFISTDFNTPVDDARFGIESLSLGKELRIPTLISKQGIPEAGFTKGRTSPVGFPIHTKVYQGHLLVAHGGGLTIVQLIEGSAFGQTNLYDFGINAIAVETSSDMAYIIGYSNDEPVMLRVDLSDINSPALLESETLNIGDNIPTSIALSNQSVYITAGEAGLLDLVR